MVDLADISAVMNKVCYCLTQFIYDGCAFEARTDVIDKIICTCSVGVVDSAVLCHWNISVCNGRYDWSEPVYSQSCYYSRYVKDFAMFFY